METERAYTLGLLLGDLLGQQNAVDVRQHTTPSNCHCTQQLGELLIIADSQLNVARYDAGLLVVACGVTRELQHLRGTMWKIRKSLLTRVGVGGGGGEEKRGGGGEWMKDVTSHVRSCACLGPSWRQEEV